MSGIEAQTRKQIASFLPKAMRNAISSYKEFSKKEMADAKEFKDHHGACKVALAHIELLLKLAKLADLPDSEFDNQNEHNDLLGLIAKAEGELNAS